MFRFVPSPETSAVSYSAHPKSGAEPSTLTSNGIFGTGASGEALDELCSIAQDVATTVPVSFAQAGDYIQDLNTRLGLTGDDLRDVATQLGALESRIGGVNVETLAGAFAVTARVSPAAALVLSAVPFTTVTA